MVDSAPATISITVVPSNHPPIVANPIADFSVTQGAANIDLDLRSVFQDTETEDADLVYSLLANSNPSLVLTTDRQADIFRLRYQLNQVAAHDLGCVTGAGGRYVKTSSCDGKPAAAKLCVGRLRSRQRRQRDGLGGFHLGRLDCPWAQWAVRFERRRPAVSSQLAKDWRLFDLRDCGRLRFRMDVVQGGVKAACGLAFIQPAPSPHNGGAVWPNHHLLVTKHWQTLYKNPSCSGTTTYARPRPSVVARSVLITGRVLDKDDNNRVI
jgi:hypothetical protein